MGQTSFQAMSPAGLWMAGPIDIKRNGALIARKVLRREIG
jgi:hypothetical protein